MTTIDIASAACTVLAPGDDGWDEARGTFNLLDDQRPELIALPRDTAEVVEAVALARRAGLRVAAQGTGHGASSRDTLAGALLVNTSRMLDVEIDHAERRVRVGAAAKWEHVAPMLSERGLAGLHGSSLDVGIAGYSMGGGIGWLTRRHGLQTNAVRAIELVTAEGEVVRADAEHHDDLFWALRGGGGNFGVVTAIEFDVVAVPELTAGSFFFPVDRTADVLRTWTRLLPTFPEELTTWVTVIHFPPTPEIPEVVRGRSFAIVMAAHLGSEAEARRLLRPLEALGPSMDTLGMQEPIALGTLAMDPESPLPYRSTTALVDDLPDATIDAVAELAGTGGSLAMLQIRHIGGAFGRRPADAGARATLPGEILVFGLGVPMDAESGAAVARGLAALDDVLAPHLVGEYPNFVEHPVDASRFFDDATWARLRAVKATWDPGDRVLGNHHVPPAAAHAAA
ncbi:oxidoreductase [Agromyces luteolus]|uniref:FAD-binding protein n=1 Tax=Agromyces luteolus TaxID=88373 RepID=A0A7C9LXH5_9MICO|nr:FAD-binding oxidoreductase [Agromyces luteolus]MUN06857.1 FAD-binding protein [Agromyces luteolus]GLK29628.1 oxidoreductase [Agromyces luteolus]